MVYVEIVELPRTPLAEKLARTACELRTAGLRILWLWARAHDPNPQQTGTLPGLLETDNASWMQPSPECVQTLRASICSSPTVLESSHSSAAYFAPTVA